MNQVVGPGLLFLKREKRALLRRWRRAMLLPETVLLAGLVIISAVLADHTAYRPGQQAQASSVAVVRDGVPSMNGHKQRALQDRLHHRPEHLMKLNARDIIAAFSYPDLQRQEAGVLVLQFRGAGCVLDVYSHDGGQSTAHYEFRPRQLAMLDSAADDDSRVRPRDCVSDILKSRRV